MQEEGKKDCKWRKRYFESGKEGGVGKGCRKVSYEKKKKKGCIRGWFMRIKANHEEGKNDCKWRT